MAAKSSRAKAKTQKVALFRHLLKQQGVETTDDGEE